MVAKVSQSAWYPPEPPTVAESKPATLASCLLSLAFVPAMMGCLVYEAFVAQHMWAWFVAPVFGVAVPRLFMLVGLFVCFAFLNVRAKPRSEDKRQWSWLRDREIAVTFSWGLAWLAHACDGWMGQ